MVKFKLFKKGLEGVKCLVKKAFITKPTHSMPRINVCNKESRNSAKSTTVASVSSAEGFIPLAARDSQWVGIEFYNPNFRSPLDEDDDAEEYELQNLAAEGMDAIFHLFPGLNKHDSLLKEHDSSSTTAITKLLVGQKADFRNMKSSRKLLPTDTKLDSVREMPQEEKNNSETDISIGSRPKGSSITDMDAYDEDEIEPVRATHVKRRKRKSDIRMRVPAIESSTDGSSTSVQQPKTKITNVNKEHMQLSTKPSVMQNTSRHSSTASKPNINK